MLNKEQYNKTQEIRLECDHEPNVEFPDISISYLT